MEALPESSRDDRAASGPKCSPAERRKRREEVALALLGGRLSQTVKQTIAAKYGISTRMVQMDISYIERQWAKDDRLSIQQQRVNVMRRLRSYAARLDARGDLAEAALVDYRIARLLGMGSGIDVHLHSDRAPIVTEPPVLPTAEHLRIVVESLMRAGMQVHGMEAGERVVEAEVVTSKNGATHEAPM